MLATGTIHDRYKIEGLLDPGSSAEVYRVTHTWLHVPMVLKLLHADVDPAIRFSLLEEGRIQSTQHHQNLVAVCDCLEIGDRLGLVLEFVDGPDLAAWIDEHPKPPLDTSLAVFRGVVDGLAEAHRRGLVHRDLKPENILLAKGEERFVPKIGDFGMAKRLARGLNSQSLSGTFSLIGTPEYMAPEQLQNPGLVDRRADLFSLGAVLYELITGDVAFDAETIDEIFALTSNARYPPVAARRSGVHPVLDRLVRSLLDPDPANRPQDCEAVLRTLDQVPPPGPVRPGGWRGRA